MTVITRRSLASTFAYMAIAPQAASADGLDAIADIERRHGGRLGVFVQDTGTGRTLTHRADERFLLQSTFKGPLAAMVLARVDSGAESLDEGVAIGGISLLPHSPVTQAHRPSGTITVGALCEAVLEQSDNSAANLLLARVGGPAQLTAFLRGLGDGVTRVDRYELVGGWSGEKDTSSPRAVAAFARNAVLGNVLKPATRAFMIGWMEKCAAGRTRLRASFPPGWHTCDRTGTGDGVCNDYAVAWPPRRAPVSIAVYYEAMGMDAAPQEAVLREVGAAIVAWAA